MVLTNLLWLQLVLETVGLVDLFVLSAGVLPDDDGELFRLTSGSLLSYNGGAVTMIGIES